MAYFPNSNLVSSGNSSTSLLTNGNTFTGTWDDVTNFECETSANDLSIQGRFSGKLVRDVDA